MRIYFDENFSNNLIAGLKIIQDGRRKEDIQVCSIADEFGKGMADEEWIPAVAAKHGVILTQDINIHRVRAQWQLCQDNQIGVFFFKPPKRGWNYWSVVRLVIHWWPEICKAAKLDNRPFAYCIEIGKRMKQLH